MAIPKRGYVYLVQLGPYYKIGRSVNPESRVKAFTSVKMPYPINLIHTIESSDPTEAEAHLHHRFADLRMNGEWFRLPDWAVGYIKLIVDIEPIDNPGAALSTQCSGCGLYELRRDALYGSEPEAHDLWSADENARLLDFVDAYSGTITGMKGW